MMGTKYPELFAALAAPFDAAGRARRIVAPRVQLRSNTRATDGPIPEERRDAPLDQ
jgi:hypothetical protein